MECFECIKACSNDALEIDKEVSCVRLEGRPALVIDGGKCNECNQCNEICPMGNIALSAEGCSFCIICKNSPNCILLGEARASFLNCISSIVRYVMLKWRVIFR